MSLRRTTSLAAAAVLALSLAACSSDEEPAASEPTSSASEEPTDEPEESPSESASTDPSTEEPSTEVAAFLDRLKAGFGDEGSVHVSMKMTGPQKIEAEGDTAYGPDGSDLRMTMLMPGMGEQPMTMVVVDEQVFVSLPGMTPAGKFFEIPEGSPMMAQFGSSGLSPAESFAAFDAGLERVEPVGTEKIGGEQTEHFELYVDSERAMAAMDQQAVPGMPETLKYDVWLDSQDRMRRLRYDVAGTSIVMDMTQWDGEVRIDAPTGDELVDAPQLQ